MNKPQQNALIDDASRKPLRRRGGKGNANPSPVRQGDARAALLSAASSLLRERGGIEPPVAEIAARAEVNAGLIGYYFGGKDSMFLALLERDFEGGLVELEKLLEAPIPVIDKLKANIAGLINVNFRSPYINQLILTLVERSPPETSEMILAQWIRPVYEAHKRMLDEGFQAGVLRNIDPMFYYYTVLGACDRVFTNPYSLSALFGIPVMTRELKQRFISHTADMLLPGLLTDEALTSYVAERSARNGA